MAQTHKRIERRALRLSRWPVLILALQLVACATPAALPAPPTITTQDLLAGPPPSEQAAAEHIPPPSDILQVQPAMQAFLQRHVQARAGDATRMRQLLKGMMQEGYLTLEYEHGETHTAAQTFALKSGNCLSFTNLFVALAREIGLSVRFQLVDIPPRWHSTESWVIFDNHINTVLPRMRIGGLYTRDYVVDFNIADYQGNYDRRQISDEQAMALMYNNLAVAQMRQQKEALALALFRQAHALYARLPGLWTNLGVLHARLGRLDKAEAALHRALELQRANPAALSNLASLYQARGETDKLSAVQVRMAYYRDKNPYYYYQQAQQHFAEQDWQTARQLVQQALSIKNDEHQFHYLNALIARQLGLPSQALASLQHAWEHAHSHRKLQQAYAAKLQHWRSGGEAFKPTG